MSHARPETPPVLATGRPEIDQLLSGVSAGALVLVEGRHAAGKSVLCQHLARHGLHNGLGVAYYSSEDPSPSLLSKAAALGLDMLDHFLLDRLRLYPLETWGARLGLAPLADRVARHLEALPPEFPLVVVDSLSALMPHSPREPLRDFLEGCRQLCRQGKTVVLTADAGPGLDWAVARLSQPPEARLRLELAAVELGRKVRTLEVTRPGQHPEWPPPPVAFHIEAGLGIRVVCWRRFRLPAGAWGSPADLA